MSGRKVRKNFDKNKGYSVNVSDCTEEMKKAVQQAFFDVGIDWLYKLHSCEYQNLDAGLYTNVTCFGRVTPNLMYASTTWGCNMAAKEFLGLVYEPEQVGHVHAELMRQYAEDAKTNPEPWKLWEIKADDGLWWDCQYSPMWEDITEYRRKHKSHTVNGVEIPDLRVKPEEGEPYYLADPLSRTFFTLRQAYKNAARNDWVERGLVYPHTEEGKQAAILHAKSMLGIA